MDDENGIVYGLFYQGFNRVLLTRNIIYWVGTLSSRVIASLDRRIVTLQHPKATDIKMGK